MTDGAPDGDPPTRVDIAADEFARPALSSWRRAIPRTSTERPCRQIAVRDHLTAFTHHEFVSHRI
jgi:hypothetical protein